MDVNRLVSSLHVAEGWRFRCFGKGASSDEPCLRPATSWAPDPKRFDAVTFFCDECRPRTARPIEPEREYLELCVSGVIVISGATLARQDAQLDALCAIQEQLAKVGASFAGVQVAGCLRRAYSILGVERAPGAPGAPSNGDPAGGR
jgi:hypothetical protein